MQQACKESGKWLRASLHQLVTSAFSTCEQQIVLMNNDLPLRFFKEQGVNLFSWHARSCSSVSFRNAGESSVTQQLLQIFEANKSHPELVNHNLYKLLLDEDLIKLAHKNLVEAAGNHKPFYERRALVRDIVRGLENEQFQFESGTKSKNQGGDEFPIYTGPLFKDRIVLEAMRIVLERVYGPLFLETSHGLRASKSRHTALRSVRRGLQHHKYALAGRTDCRNLDSHVLVKLLEGKIGDKLFVRLIWKALNAGYGERKNKLWTIKSVWEGRPEFLDLSTTLTNIYFHAVDCWVRDRKQTFDRGTVTGTIDPQLVSLTNRIQYLKHEGKLKRVKLLSLRRAKIARRGWADKSCQKLFYVRYVDDMLLSFVSSKEEVVQFRKDLEEFLVQDMKLGISEGGFRLSHLQRSHAVFLGTNISVSKTSLTSQNGSRQVVTGRVRMEAPMDKIIEEFTKLRMVSQGGTHPHPVTFLARCSHNEIINYYNWIMRGCCTYYSFVDNFYQLTSYLRVALRSSCVRTLTMKLKRYRSARTYKDFGTECAARYRVPVKDGVIVHTKLSTEERGILKRRMQAAKRLKLEWEALGEVEKGLLQRFIIPKRIRESNGDVSVEFRGDYLLYCSNKSEHEETMQALRKLDLFPPPQNVWDFRETIVPPPRPQLSIDYEKLYPF